MGRIAKYEILDIARNTDIGKQYNLDMGTLSKCYDAIVEALGLSIKTATPEDKVVLYPLGTFIVKDTAPRKYHDIKEGTMKTSEGGKRIMFKSTGLKNYFKYGQYEEDEVPEENVQPSSSM